MSWFRKKGKYWYYVYRLNGREIQKYMGDHTAILSMISSYSREILPKEKYHDRKRLQKGSRKQK